MGLFVSLFLSLSLSLSHPLVIRVSLVRTITKLGGEADLKRVAAASLVAKAVPPLRRCGFANRE